jgi:hypothetical protein
VACWPRRPTDAAVRRPPDDEITRSPELTVRLEVAPRRTVALPTHSSQASGTSLPRAAKSVRLPRRLRCLVSPVGWAAVMLSSPCPAPPSR